MSLAIAPRNLGLLRLAAVLFGLELAASVLPHAPVAGQQPNATGSAAAVMGGVIDGATGAALPSVLVTVQAVGDSTSVSRRLTDPRGHFLFPGLTSGRYTVSFQVLGYAPLSQEVQVGPGVSGAANLGNVALTATALQLDEVQVVAERSPVTIEADRDVYAVDAMPVAGGTATDVLTNVADVQLDADGNVTLRGERPTIYINGRPAPMRGDALAMFLQTYAAENIETVEVMANPSARYEAEGTGGIINIVLRRGASLGLTGNASLNGGTRGDLGGSVRTTYMAGDLTLIGGTTLRLTRTESRTSELRENRITDPVTFFGQDALSNRSTWSGNADLSAEYSLGENTEIEGELRLTRNSASADRLTTYTELDAAQAITDEYDRLIADDGAGTNADIAVQLTRELGRRNHELAFEVQYQRGQDAEESLIRQRILEDLGEIDPIITEVTWEEDNETESEISLQADYVRPFGERGQIELGVQTDFGRTDEGRYQEVREGENGIPETTLQRGFVHEQNVTATYLTAMQRLGDFSLQLGLRGERAATSVGLPGEEGYFEHADFNVFPNANLTYNLGAGKRVRLSYSMRVQRPSSSVLNPTNTSDDPMNRRVGNPDVQPQQTHSVTLDGSWSGDLGTIRVSPFLRRSVDEWERFKTVDAQGISTTTYENLGETTTFGGSLNLSVRQYKGFGGSVNLSAQHQQNDWGALLERAPESITSWSVQSNLSSRISSTLNLQASATFNPARDLPQGRTSSTFMTRLSLRQRLLDGRGSLNLNVSDPFELYRPTTRTTDRAFVETGRERPSARTATLSFSYSFGGRGRGRPGAGTQNRAPGSAVAPRPAGGAENREPDGPPPAEVGDIDGLSGDPDS